MEPNLPSNGKSQAPAEPPTSSGATSGRRWPLAIVALAVLAGVAYWLFQNVAEPLRAATTPAARPAGRAIPVVVASTRQADLPVYLTGLGTVTAFNTVTVRSRVDGELTKVAFREGQFVHQGDLLAEIDPRPFEVQLKQAEGQLARDTAQLKDARINLERYRDLLARQFISKQQFDDQAAQVGQYEGTLKVDQAAIDNAKLQLTYSRITAPISGRIGLRLVDAGNMVHASDQNGLLIITEVQPIAVLFTIPEDELPPVMKKLRAGERLAVTAYDRAGKHALAEGFLLTADNQIDTSTGTTRLKAIFENHDDALFPNQFVNVKLLLHTVKGAVIAPLAAVQRGPAGTFVYVVQKDQTVTVRPVTVGPTTGPDAAIEAGLAPGEQVVVEGVDKLRPGAVVQPHAPRDAASAPSRPTS